MGGALFGGHEEPAEDVFYHYTGIEKLKAILESRSLRLSSYSATNDPRESRAWYFPIAMDVGEEHPSDVRSDEVWDGFDELVRKRAKVACFGQDRLPVEGVYDRGFARARMWDQYAEKHAGACLLVSRPGFIDAAERALTGSRLRHGPVRYTDDVHDSLGLLTLKQSELRALPLNELADQFSQRHYDALFFRKNTDWASEGEYRFVAMTDSSFESVQVDGLVRAIILGEASTERDERFMRLLTGTWKSPPVIARMSWFNGWPQVVPGLLDVPRSPQ